MKQLPSKPWNIVSHGTHWHSGCWLSKGGRPLSIGRSEGRIYRVEGVMIQGVVDLYFLAIKCSDRDLFQRNDLVRWYSVGSPIPERLAKLGGSCIPSWFIHSVGCGDLHGMLLDNLLAESMVSVSNALLIRGEPTSMSIMYGLCQVGNKTDPCVQYPPQVVFWSQVPVTPFQGT